MLPFVCETISRMVRLSLIVIYVLLIYLMAQRHITKDRRHIQMTSEKDRETRKDPTWIRKVKVKAYKDVRFLTSDMWHIQTQEVHGFRRLYINTLKALFMAIKGFVDQRLSSHASALTYRTLLSLVPMIAVLVALAKGFGVQGTIYDFLMTYMPGHQSEIDTIMGFVENYLGQVQGGLFLGVGLVLFLYTIFVLLDAIEQTFNIIWGVPRGRALGRKLTDYVTMVVILPLLMTLSSGLTVVMATIQNTWFNDYILFTPVLKFLLKLLPYIILIFMFAGMFMALPNTRVKFLPALISGVIAGSAFQILQALYVSGILWISKYNAIYGGFAAIPLLLLWLQVVWTITLFSAKLCFSIQNVVNFTYAKDATNVSHRYQDFLTLLVMAHIVQRFLDHTEPEPHDIPSLSEACHLPISQTSEIITRLLEERLIIEVIYSDRDKKQCYSLAVDPEILTVGYLLDRMDRSGHRSLMLTQQKFSAEWDIIVASRRAFAEPPLTILLSDLPLGKRQHAYQ